MSFSKSEKISKKFPKFKESILKNLDINQSNFITELINGKYYEHNLDDINKYCKNLPSNDSRINFKITLIQQKYIFYHDKDILINKTEPFINNLLLNKSKTDQVSKEYLVTRSNVGLKFELLSNKKEDINQNLDLNKSNESKLDYFTLKSIEWECMKNNLVDSHCHFDMLFDKIKFADSISDYFSKFKKFYLNNFEACINVICDPNKYNTKFKINTYFEKYKHDKVFFTIGCHPHFAYSWSKQAEDILYSNLNDPKIIAIGECGLDLSKKNNVDMDHQIQIFEIQVKIAKQTNKTIVIHSRNTEENCFELLKMNLNKDHRIHLHCFTGNWTTAKKYLDHFPNLCIGVTPLITQENNLSDEFKEMLMNVPLDRFLLETDAPYFIPRLKNFPINEAKYSHPGFVFATAECLAKLRNVTTKQIVDLNRSNIQKIYLF